MVGWGRDEMAGRGHSISFEWCEVVKKAVTMIECKCVSSLTCGYCLLSISLLPFVGSPGRHGSAPTSVLTTAVMATSSSVS